MTVFAKKVKINSRCDKVRGKQSRIYVVTRIDEREENRMKVVIAIDSFKGSMSSLEAGNAARRGILHIVPDAEVLVRPLADGGEGTLDALVEGMQGEKRCILVQNPLGYPTSCAYGILPDGTAIVEMAQAAGITKLNWEERNPLFTSTYGVGEVIADAIKRGCRRFVIGIGGSATNDGGMGMMSALGYEFLDQNRRPVQPGAEGLAELDTIRTHNIIPELRECEFRIACDVDNPLCGNNGATYVYGGQKGLHEELFQSIDEGMAHYAMVVEQYTDSKGSSKYPGAGAAGGLGFAFLAFLHGQLVSGVDLILDTICIEDDIKQADFVITGEGKLDAQTLRGKAPVGVAKRARKYDCKVFAFAGDLGDGAEECCREGIDRYFAIADESVPFEERIKRENAIRNMEIKVEEVFRKYTGGQ